MIGQDNIFAHHRFPSARVPDGVGAVGTERALGYQCGAVASLKTLHCCDAQQIVIILHACDQRGFRILNEQIAGDASASLGNDVVHDLLYCVLFQTGIRIDGEEKRGADQLKAVV